MQSPLVAVMRTICPPGLSIVENALLSRFTRFEVGGPARILADAATDGALIEILRAIREAGEPHTLMGGGTNLVVSDQGYDGVVLRYTNPALEIAGNAVSVAAGAVLQELVDDVIARGLKGLETMTGIPGWVGGAVYGNAGAYGHSIHERVSSVRFLEIESELECVREIGNVKLLARAVEGVETKDLKSLVDDGKKQIGSGVVAIVGVTEDGKAGIVVGVTSDLTARFNAVDLVRKGSEALGGKGGGGRPDMAQAGGPDGAKANAALSAIEKAMADA